MQSLGIQADKTWKKENKKRQTFTTSKNGSLQSLSIGKGCSLPHMTAMNSPKRGWGCSSWKEYFYL